MGWITEDGMAAGLRNDIFPNREIFCSRINGVNFSCIIETIYFICAAELL